MVDLQRMTLIKTIENKLTNILPKHVLFKSNAFNAVYWGINITFGHLKRHSRIVLILLQKLIKVFWGNVSQRNGIIYEMSLEKNIILRENDKYSI